MTKQFFTMVKIDARYLKRFKVVGNHEADGSFGSDTLREVFVPEKVNVFGKKEYSYDRHGYSKQLVALAS